MAYEIIIQPGAVKDLEKLPKAEAVKVKGVIMKLAENPYPTGSKKLLGVANTYRVRKGNYRILYEVENKVLTVYIIKV